MTLPSDKSRRFESQGGEFPGWCKNCGKHRSLHRGHPGSKEGDPEWCSTPSSIGTLEGLPNLRAIIDGRVSGHYTEWPMVRAELREMVTQWERALGDLNLALHAELLDTGLVTAEQWNEAIAPKLKACGQAIRMQDRIGQRSSPVSATGAKTCRMQDGPPIPWALAEAIWQGYALLGGGDQPLEVVDRRGGFGWDEVAHIWKHSESRRAIEAHLRRADDGAEKP